MHEYVMHRLGEQRLRELRADADQHRLVTRAHSRAGETERRYKRSWFAWRGRWRTRAATT